MTTGPQPMVSEVGFAVIVVLAVMIYLVVRWFRQGVPPPDPWEQAGETSPLNDDTPMACHRCSTPQAPGANFCPQCGAAVGPYNNWMPFEQIFSEGEVLRNGTTQRMPPTPLIIIGYVLLSLSGFLFFAPLYWIMLAKNLQRWRRHAAEVD
ncbi:MAG: zinc ribbon domain-containing protein [Verrucomicrobia bacterium]|nr:zinc ribbon domain-containing protein [Verrucomicrobiota bacterium]